MQIISHAKLPLSYPWQQMQTEVQQLQQTVAANIALIASPQGGKSGGVDATDSVQDEARGVRERAQGPAKVVPIWFEHAWCIDTRALQQTHGLHFLLFHTCKDTCEHHLCAAAWQHHVCAPCLNINRVKSS